MASATESSGHHDWWEPDSFGLALIVALVSTACWGSWSNTAKAAGDRVNFAHYYTDFCLGTVLAALLFWALPGQTAMGGPEVTMEHCYWAAAAGALFGVANLMLTTGIALVGLSIAFPLCIGTALVLGTVLTYFVDPRGEPWLIFPGVFLALLGVIANARAYGLLEQHRKEARSSSGSGEDSQGSSTEESSDDEGGKGAQSSATKNILLCVLGGVLMSTWAPLSTKGMEKPNGLSPYSSFVIFTVVSMVVGVAIVSGQQCGCSLMPRVGAATSATEYFQMSPLLHGWGLLGGFVWATGTACNLVSGEPLGHALSYALGQTAPVVAVLWGLLWYHEFDGAPKKSKIFLAVMFVCFILAITLLCLGGK